ncbi:MAG: sigma-70 family RNA polymerase sigma factor [Chloroflexi bacterium]|nr:sigma-70 family RNA polymerase sigma factor [Chloroflexota bacterium]
MRSYLPSDEALVKRLLPDVNPDPQDRTHAWNEWHACVGNESVLKFIRARNDTAEPDEDILQDALITAYLEVERGRYEYREGIPFTAYVKGIAWNKIREARRRTYRPHRFFETGEVPEEYLPADSDQRQLEDVFERAQEHEALQHGLAQLPASRRQVLERYIQGERMAEIAEALEITEELARQHKRRALVSLQNILG